MDTFLLTVAVASLVGSFLGTFCALSFISWFRTGNFSKKADDHNKRMAAIEEGKLRILK